MFTPETSAFINDTYTMDLNTYFCDNIVKRLPIFGFDEDYAYTSSLLIYILLEIFFPNVQLMW